ncbi:MAG: type II CAAX prenyl endopeptidase Rce1 family protein [Candidatus Methylacidiphilales bacterium]
MNTGPLRAFLWGMPLFLLAVVVVSASASPWIFEWVDSMAPGRWPFKRVFNRVLMVTAILFLIPWLRCMGAASRSKTGISFQRGWWRGLCWGWVIGVAHVSMLTVLHVSLGAREWNWELTGSRWIGYFFSGWAVAAVEEWIFRGALCLALRDLSTRALTWVVVLGSLFFALLHFPQARHMAEGVEWWSGWAMWGDLGMQLLDGPEVLRRGVGLWMIGVCLCVVALRSGGLWWAVGIHAGWVCAIKSVNRMTDATVAAESLWWGGHPLDGVVAWLMVGLLAAVCWWWPWKRTERAV